MKAESSESSRMMIIEQSSSADKSEDESEESTDHTNQKAEIVFEDEYKPLNLYKYDYVEQKAT
jgi:hypothetical protein